MTQSEDAVLSLFGQGELDGVLERERAALGPGGICLCAEGRARGADVASRSASQKATCRSVPSDSQSASTDARQASARAASPLPAAAIATPCTSKLVSMTSPSGSAARRLSR